MPFEKSVKNNVVPVIFLTDANFSKKSFGLSNLHRRSVPCVFKIKLLTKMVKHRKIYKILYIIIKINNNKYINTKNM